MNITEIAALAAALISTISLIVTIRGKKFDAIEKRFDALDVSDKEIKKDIRESENRITSEIRVLDSRISHIEGYLMGRDFKTGTGEK